MLKLNMNLMLAIPLALILVSKVSSAENVDVKSTETKDASNERPLANQIEKYYTIMPNVLKKEHIWTTVTFAVYWPIILVASFSNIWILKGQGPRIIAASAFNLFAHNMLHEMLAWIFGIISTVIIFILCMNDKFLNLFSSIGVTYFPLIAVGGVFSIKGNWVLLYVVSFIIFLVASLGLGKANKAYQFVICRGILLGGVTLILLQAVFGLRFISGMLHNDARLLPSWACQLVYIGGLIGGVVISAAFHKVVGANETEVPNKQSR